MPPTSSPKTILSDQPIEIPNLLAWRWRAQRAIRSNTELEKELEQPACKDYAEDVSYFLDNVAARKERLCVILTNNEHLADEECNLSGNPGQEDGAADLPTLINYLDDTFPIFSKATVYNRPKAVSLIRPDKFEEKLKGISKLCRKNSQDAVTPIVNPLEHLDIYSTSNNKQPILPGLLYVLRLTQIGTIWQIGTETTQPTSEQQTTTHQRIARITPSFNHLIDRVTSEDDIVKLRKEVAQYISALRESPFSDIHERIELHRELSGVLGNLDL